jgi:hypothetical protein
MLSTVLINTISFILGNYASSLDRWHHDDWKGWQKRARMPFKIFSVFSKSWIDFDVILYLQQGFRALRVSLCS